ncbi:MAG: hypothetical protein FWD43_04980 [Coriobacteriia bacterium]|nr:hypothetical protein [Coriobacteriia bacterium]
MLGKLLKYEFKATARLFLILYLALIAVSALNALLISLGGSTYGSFDNEVLVTVYSTITGLAIFLYVLISTAVVVATIIIIIVRFYRMLGNEGYLWFTLPVTANQQILGKLIPALVWSFVSTIVFIISFGILLMPMGITEMIQGIPEIWSSLIEMGLNPTLWTVCLLILLIVGGFEGYLMFYASMAIGPNIIKSRLGGTVLAYLILYVAMQIVSTIQMVLLVIPLNNLATSIDNALMWGNIAGVMSAVDSIMVYSTVFYGIAYLVIGIVFYLLTRYFMSRKLNLA